MQNCVVATDVVNALQVPVKVLLQILYYQYMVRGVATDVVNALQVPVKVLLQILSYQYMVRGVI